MRVALVHDYIKEFGGAERVLKVLTELYPEAPIYTAFSIKGSDAEKEFADRKIVESKWAGLIKHGRLYSPLRFLLPWIWGSLDLSEYDLVITSCSNYVARGFRTGKNTKVVAYCHTPPRFLYGYTTGVSMQKYWPIKVYALLISYFLRQFDQKSAKQVDKWIVNSVNVQKRVEKIYGKESVVVYPPVEVEKFMAASENAKKEDYFLIVARLVGSKGLEEAVKAAKHLKFKLKIAGGSAGLTNLFSELKKMGEGYVEMLGRVSEERLVELYARAKGFIALARDEDFGMTVVEAEAAGTPVIAFNGGGFKESVKDGETGILIEDTHETALELAIDKFEKTNWDREKIQEWSRKFSKENFIEGFKKAVSEYETE